MKNFKIDEHDKVKTPFEVPESYFDQLNKEILAKTVESSTEVNTDNQRWLSPIKLMVAASISALVIISSIFLFQSESAATTEELLAEVSSDDIYYYLSESELTEEEIITELNLEELEFIDDNPLNDLDLNDLELNEFLYDIDLSENI